MARNHETGSSAQARQAGREAIIADLCRLPAMGELSYVALRVVAAIRLLAVCGKAGRDPLAELSQRFGSVTTAKAFLAFADHVGTFWPENVNVMRPCACVLSPDEATLARMADAARAADRDAFARSLAGFVRPGRQEALYEKCREIAALL